MLGNETVSVAMCTFNGSEFVAEQLESILSQTYPISEIIICDDASTDATISIIESYCKKEGRIKLYQNEARLGFTKNFEQAIRLSTGTYIAIADQDDIWMPKKIELLIGQLDKDAPLIYCDSIRFKNEIPTVLKENPLYRRFFGSDARKLFLFNTVSGHAMLFKRSFVSLILPFKEGLFYDWCMAAIAGCNGGISYCSETLVLQRIHSNNISIEKSEMSGRETLVAKRNEAINHLEFFSTIPNIKASHAQLATKLFKALKSRTSFYQKIYLFLLLLINRNLLFNYKKRRWSLPSHIKLAFAWAFNS